MNIAYVKERKMGSMVEMLAIRPSIVRQVLLERERERERKEWEEGREPAQGIVVDIDRLLPPCR